MAREGVYDSSDDVVLPLHGVFIAETGRLFALAEQVSSHAIEDLL